MPVLGLIYIIFGFAKAVERKEQFLYFIFILLSFVIAILGPSKHKFV
jgi:hypothetical protein